MAATLLSTPIIRAIAPFDPSCDFTIEFIYSGDPVNVGHNIYINEITDINPENHITYVYKAYEQQGCDSHTIPAGTLEAGKKYSVFVMVYDREDTTGNTYSQWSDEVPFWCFTTPEFNLRETNSTHHESTSINLNLVYSQAENEILNNYQFIKCDSSGTQLEVSPVMTVANNSSYTFDGLDNLTTYRFKAIGETKHGMLLETPEIIISVSVDAIPMDVSVEAVNDYMHGTVNLTFNVKDIEYILSGEDYTFSNGMVTLNNTSLTYNDGFIISDNFSLFLEAYKVAFGTFLSLDDFIQLSIMKICGIYYGVLSIKGSDFKKYVKLENAAVSEDGQLILDTTKNYVTFIIRRNSGYYDLELK